MEHYKYKKEYNQERTSFRMYIFDNNTKFHPFQYCRGDFTLNEKLNGVFSPVGGYEEISKEEYDDVPWKELVGTIN
jgi:hypothetical protein